MVVGVALDDLDEPALLALVGSDVREGRRLEFKSELPGGSDRERRESVADVTSFANTVGGDLLWGVEETDGVVTGVPGVQGDPDAHVLRLEAVVRDGTEPRLTGVRTRVVAVGDGGRHVIAMRVPRSWAGPHRVVANNRFYGRNSAGKYELDVRELRDLFRPGDDVVARVRRLHRDRVATVEAGDAPLPGLGTPLTMLTVVPFSALSDAVALPLFDDDRLRQGVGTFGGGAMQTFPVLEGVLGSDTDGTGANRGYGLLHRTGFVEYADRWLIEGSPPTNGRSPVCGWRTRWSSCPSTRCRSSSTRVSDRRSRCSSRSSASATTRSTSPAGRMARSPATSSTCRPSSSMTSRRRPLDTKPRRPSPAPAPRLPRERRRAGALPQLRQRRESHPLTPAPRDGSRDTEQRSGPPRSSCSRTRAWSNTAAT